ncbi:DNA methyltransferase [Kineococcus sp. NPDC059986]|uniref:Eco57I restriction-modification methylase domain-containing protein n=1 Tax=Kineococcus sp. NPDC059986 TaxID=3155538 RepID=UPI00344C04C4
MARRRRRSYGAGEAARKRHAWLESVRVSGLFLSVPVLERVFPDGYPAVPSDARAATRRAVNDYLDVSSGQGGGKDSVLRHRLVETVLREALDWGPYLVQGNDLPSVLAEPVADHGIVLRPDFAFRAAPEEASAVDDAIDEVEEDDDEAEDAAPETEASEWRLLGMVTTSGTYPLDRTDDGGWVASPVERLAVLLRARSVPVGVVTDGRWWALVWAPVGGAVGAAVFDAESWSPDPDTFRAFVALLERRRFLAVAAEDLLPALFAESAEAQEGVTEALGAQVRDAVELFLATIDELDAESGGAVLDGVDDDALYEAAVTVMMRIVFLLFAEDRRLLPSDDDLYVSAYSVARLADQLQGQADVLGEQSLENRTSAWHRLLATSRALHGGVHHEDLRLPAYGGSLFDPDRYPWLEGRRTAEDADSAEPLSIDDRTVLRMLRAVQFVEVDGERRRLSFRALDVEQIGYVYEGLLELEVRTAEETTLLFTRSAKWPRARDEKASEVPLWDAIGWASTVPPSHQAQLKTRTGRSEGVIEKHLRSLPDADDERLLLRATGGDRQLVDQAQFFAPLLHHDVAGRIGVVLPGRRYVAPSIRRASTGTHYTPRELAEEVVQHSLEPLVYRPGPLEQRDGWRIRPSSEILALRVADIAMGSGAFLVAACRYLADRLVEAWVAEGRRNAILAQRPEVRRVSGDADVEAVALEARRLVAEHCLYGVDINPLAVEMAKLSLWLVTMDDRRPFGFLDDRLLAGDSLLGLVSVEQLQTFHADPAAVTNQSAFVVSWWDKLSTAADDRRRITATPANDSRDIEDKQRLLAQIREDSADVAVVADTITGVGLRVAAVGAAKARDDAFKALQWRVQIALDGAGRETLAKQAEQDLNAGRPEHVPPRQPLHWPVAFPEVFVDAQDRGFDAIVGNPPFSGGQKLSGSMGDDYLAWLQRWDGRGVKGSADLAARFVLRAERLLSERGQLGYITTNTLVQGATVRVGMEQVVGSSLHLRRARSSHKWPSASANLEIVDVWGSRRKPASAAVRWLDGEEVPSIGADLEPVGRIAGRPYRLVENEDVAFQGSNVLGLGFTLTEDEAAELVAADPRNAEVVQSYVIGKDLNQRPDCSASRQVINFRDWPLERAERYTAPMTRVRRLVKPDRDKQKDRQRRMLWWRFTRPAPELYEAIADLDHVLALSLVSNAVLPVRVPAGQVFAHRCCVFALDDFASLALLSSSVHSSWVIRYTSTLETRINYAPSDVFLTLPRPASTPEMHHLGEELDTVRRELMLSRGWGLTTTYNHVHSPAVQDPEVLRLRRIHERIDAAVFTAYGWDNLNPQVGHHPTKIGTRWTISKDLRFEVLDRLLEENHRRHALEQGRR